MGEPIQNVTGGCGPGCAKGYHVSTSPMTGPTPQAKVDNFTPSTAHGRALLDWPENFGYHHPDCEVTAEDNCTCDLADHILAIEQEARADAEHAERSTLDNTRELVQQYQEALADADAQIAVLRALLDDFVLTVLSGGDPTRWTRLILRAKNVLSDLPAAAQAHDARIRADAVKQERARVAALVNNDPLYRSLDGRAVRALLDPATGVHMLAATEKESEG